ncbi:hypothetical protein K2X92_00040 [Candidatus Gracilibacteria bacterium]|nr:hypothetical protein [Candidatus Gracilibacteria bacterium]
MAILHAGSTPRAEIISHSHDSITESHIVETSDDPGPPHCTQTKVEISIIQQVRDNIDGEIEDFFKGSISYYSDNVDIEYPLTQDTYFQYYPGSENNFFGHLLVGEKILLI